MALTSKEAYDILMSGFESANRLRPGGDYDDPEYADGWYLVEEYFYPKSKILSSSGHTISLVTDFGGEGQGDEKWLVLKFVSEDGAEQLFRKDGYYSSYDGGSWDGDFYEAEAVVRPVTFYEKKKVSV